MSSIVSQLTDRCTAILFARNTVASFFAFGLDVGLLWIFVEKLGLSYLVAATIAFLVAMTLHYILSRLWVFSESRRGMASGYVYFLANAGIGLVVTLGAFAALMAITGLHYLIARIFASVAGGLIVFGLNAVFNFKAIGGHERTPRREERQGV